MTSIGDYAFSGCTGFTSITIPDSVTSIGYDAFSGCTGLTSVTIPDSVTSIGNFAFSGCTGLTSVTIPDSVTNIGGSAFSSCPIEMATIPALAANHINNSQLKTVTITSGERINERAFSGCANLTAITIPDSVTSIGSGAFYGCTGLKDVYITDIGKWCGICFEDWTATPLNYAHNLYLDGTLITNLVIPNGVTSIGGYAFYDCTGLTSITIPDGVINIGGSAFSGCTGLTSITIPDSVTSIGAYAFSGCTGMKGVYITDIGKWCGISFENYDGNPLYYAHNLYLNETLITNLVIPNGVTSIGGYAFVGCAGLTSITIPNGVTSIGGSAFSGCTGLTSITIPDSVTSIVWCAFSGCTGLTSITIPASVTSVGDYAFYGCASLTSIKFQGTKAQWYAIEGINGIGVYCTVYCTDGNITIQGHHPAA